MAPLDEQKFTELCRLSLENYLEQEKIFFSFADTIYVWDKWDVKKTIFTLALANMFTNICMALEQSLKLLIQNPLNNLKPNFARSFGKKDVRNKKTRLLEIKNDNYKEVGLKYFLDFKQFRAKLNKASVEVLYARPPGFIQFENLFGKKNEKPEWYEKYEEVKHNMLSAYELATVSLVMDALASYYLVASIIAQEGSSLELPENRKKYFPWYEGKIRRTNKVTFPTSPHWLSHFKSNHFFRIEIIKK